MATYAIGDIQGCYKALRKLLNSAQFDPCTDTLWCVGDLVNRGPESLDTLRFLRDLDDRVNIVLGNHDLHFLAIHYGCAPARSRDTLDVLLAAQDCDQLATWLRGQPLVHCASMDTTQGPRRYLMVHAGVAPRWDLATTLQLAGEVAQALRGPDFREYFRHMYGDTPRRWRSSLTGYKRLRSVTNHLTRMRFCDEKGNMDLRTKEGLDSAPKGFRPWYEFEQLTPATTILFGHWAALEGRVGRPGIHALDTGCVWGRELTMMRLEDQRYFRV